MKLNIERLREKKRSSVKDLKFFISIIKDPNDRKYAFRWILSLKDNYLLKNKQPWITFCAIDFLNRLDLTGKKVFEYGSGGSTLYWLSRGCTVVSVEHDKNWYEKIKAVIKNNENFEYHFVEPEPIPKDYQTREDVSDPDQYISHHFLPNFQYFKKYVSTIDKFGMEYFDVILIDGRARPSCIKHSIKAIKKDGIIILDNSDRDYYLERTRFLMQNFKELNFRGISPINRQIDETKIFYQFDTLKNSENLKKH
jgi:hypothetical protein